MLHVAVDAVHHLVQVTAEGRSLPTTCVSFDAQAVAPTTQTCEPAAIIIFREFTVMALRGVVAQRGGLIQPSTWGKIKAATQFAAIFLAFVRLSEPWGPWYLDQWAMLVAVVATVGSMWGYLTAFWEVVSTEPSEVST